MEELPDYLFVQLAEKSDPLTLVQWYQTSRKYQGILDSQRMLDLLTRLYHLREVHTFREFLQEYYTKNVSLEALEIFPLLRYAELLDRELKVDILFELLVDENRTEELDLLLSEFSLPDELLADAIPVVLSRGQDELAYVLLSNMSKYPENLYLVIGKYGSSDLAIFLIKSSSADQKIIYLVKAATTTDNEDYLRSLVPYLNTSTGYYLIRWATQRNRRDFLDYLDNHLSVHPRHTFPNMLLRSAAAVGNLELVQQAIAKGARDLPIPFQLALDGGYRDVAVYLLNVLDNIANHPESSLYNPRLAQRLWPRMSRNIARIQSVEGAMEPGHHADFDG